MITPDDVHHLRVDPDQTHAGGMSPSEVFIFNVQQLFPPKNDGSGGEREQGRRRTWAFQESSGVLGETLAEMNDLVVIIDEVHLFGARAKIYQQAFKALKRVVR